MAPTKTRNQLPREGREKAPTQHWASWSAGNRQERELEGHSLLHPTLDKTRGNLLLARCRQRACRARRQAHLAGRHRLQTFAARCSPPNGAQAFELAAWQS